MRFIKISIFICLIVLAPSLAWAQGRIYRVAVDTSYPPFVFFDEDKGDMIGFDPDIARAVCAHMQINCLIVPVPFDEIIDAVHAGLVDIGTAGMVYTPERAQKVIFTDQYFRSSNIFLGPAEIFEDASLESLSGAKVAVQIATIQEDYLKKIYGNEINIIAVSGFDDVMAAVRDKIADVGFVDSLPGYHYQKTPKGANLAVLGETVYLNSGARMILTRGLEPLRNRINAALEAIRLDGTYSYISLKYFERNIY
ncbi:MAG: substrate-binding periplasmic protein [Candidatus Adiutrix sp.]